MYAKLRVSAGLVAVALQIKLRCACGCGCCPKLFIGPGAVAVRMWFKSKGKVRFNFEPPCRYV